MRAMISYRSVDAAIATEVAEMFSRELGVQPWIDTERVKPGMKWRDELRRAVVGCDVFISILSKSYLESEHCMMELFLARSLEKRVLPVMIEDCWDDLDADEASRGLRDYFMVRLFDLRMAGLPVSREEAFKRLATSANLRNSMNPRPVYVSHLQRDAIVATNVARELEASGVKSWVATLNTPVGADWRQEQVRALAMASAHVVVLSPGITQQPIIRTEMLLAEAFNLHAVAVYPPDVASDKASIAAINAELRNAHLSYRPLYDVGAFSLGGSEPFVSANLVQHVTSEIKRRNGSN